MLLSSKDKLIQLLQNFQLTPSLPWCKLHTQHQRGRSKSVSQHQYQSLVWIMKVGSKVQISTEPKQTGWMWHLRGSYSLQEPGKWRQFGGNRAEGANLTLSFPQTSLASEDYVFSHHYILSTSPPLPCSLPTPMSWLLPNLSTWTPSLGIGKHEQWPVLAGEDKHHL